MAKLSQVTNAPIRTLLGNTVLNRIVLAINAASAATVKTTNAIEYTINGVVYNKATLAAQAITVTHNWQGNSASAYVQPINKTAYYVLALDSSGNVKCIQGNYAGQTLAQDPTVGVGQSVMGATWVGDGSIPDVPADLCAFGIIKVVTGSAAFTPATTALDAANITFTFYDIARLPAGTL